MRKVFLSIIILLSVNCFKNKEVYTDMNVMYVRISEEYIKYCFNKKFGEMKKNLERKCMISKYFSTEYNFSIIKSNFRTEYICDTIYENCCDSCGDFFHLTGLKIPEEFIHDTVSIIFDKMKEMHLFYSSENDKPFAIQITSPFIQAPLHDKVIFVGEAVMLSSVLQENKKELNIKGFKKSYAYVSNEHMAMKKIHIGFRFYFLKNNCIPEYVDILSNLEGFTNIEGKITIIDEYSFDKNKRPQLAEVTFMRELSNIE